MVVVLDFSRGVVKDSYSQFCKLAFNSYSFVIGCSGAVSLDYCHGAMAGFTVHNPEEGVFVVECCLEFTGTKRAIFFHFSISFRRKNWYPGIVDPRAFFLQAFLSSSVSACQAATAVANFPLFAC